MEQADIGWAAGILDGEGNLCLTQNARGRGCSVRIEVVSTSQPLIEKFLRIARGLGAEATHVHDGRKWNKWAINPQYRCFLGKREQVILLLRVSLPHLTEKRAFAQAIVDYFGSREWGASWDDEDVRSLTLMRSQFMPKSTGSRWVVVPKEEPDN